ncbi:SH3 domain-containing protein [Acinetobacter baumannii]|nr:SH3 domain-containing protein [Acinetobacter baumannii]MCF4588332.1 SH3 domain-containing protein [Acinetobacter baumannii]MCF4626946.1 SH3 domain-containing protein [Acinetobacter baumannii]MCT9369885.1 SH3 domain-containing protein [Acinetobacter baumannii]MDC5493958.1 SH3 domain-containing protein [Acinetobacter baumannii]
MDLNDELERIFRFQNHFSKKIDVFSAFQNNSPANEFMKKFNKNNNLYIKLYDQLSPSAILELNKWNNLINNSYINKYKLHNDLYKLQNQNSFIFKLFERQEFIDNFIERFIDEGLDNFEGDAEPKEVELNVFGEMIRQEVEAQPTSSQDGSNFDYKQLTNALLYALFLIVFFYAKNHDYFKDIHEAAVFFINQIDCKGVTISRVNLRGEPNFTSEALLTIPKNSVLIIYDETHNGWVKVKVNLNNIDVEGYVSEAYIRRLE